MAKRNVRKKIPKHHVNNKLKLCVLRGGSVTGETGITPRRKKGSANIGPRTLRSSLTRRGRENSPERRIRKYLNEQRTHNMDESTRADRHPLQEFQVQQRNMTGQIYGSNRYR